MFQFKVWKNKNIFSVVNKETSRCWKQKKLYLTLSFQSSFNASRLEKPWPWDRSWPRLEPELLRGCWRMPRKSLHFHPRHPECWHLHARTREHSSQRCNGKQQPAVEWEVFWEVRHPFWLLQLYHPHLPCFSPTPSPEKDHFSRLHSIKVTNQPYHALVLFGSRSHVRNETLQRLRDLWKDLSPARSLTLNLQLNPLQALQSKAVACSIRNDSCGSHLRPSLNNGDLETQVFCMKKKQHQCFWKKVSWNTQNTVPKTDGSIFWPKHTRSGVFFFQAVPVCKKEWSLLNIRRFMTRPTRGRSDSTLKSPVPGARLALPTPPVLAGTMMGREATWTWMRMPSFLRRSRAIRSMRHQPRSDHVLFLKVEDLKAIKDHDFGGVEGLPKKEFPGKQKVNKWCKWAYWNSGNSQKEPKANKKDLCSAQHLIAHSLPILIVQRRAQNDKIIAFGHIWSNWINCQLSVQSSFLALWDGKVVEPNPQDLLIEVRATRALDTTPN